MSRVTLWLTVILALAVMGSGIGVSYIKYLSRKTFAQLQTVSAKCDQAETRWMRMQLEESTLAGYSLVESRARSQLGLHIPTINEIQVLR